MDKFIKIAQSLADLYKLEILRLDIQYISMKHYMTAYLSLGDFYQDIALHEFEIKADGSFSCLD